MIAQTRLSPLVAGLIMLLFGCGWFQTQKKELTVTVISARPHDPAAYTQGLQFYDGKLWESTGLYGQSTVREVRPDDGRVLRAMHLPGNFFGEGIALHDGELWVLTWRERTALVLDPDTFATNRTYHYEGEGWGLTTDGEHLIMSDGTSALQFRSPEDFSLLRKLAVTENGKPLNNLNELEYVDGHIYANIFMTDRIVRIDARRGHVTGFIDVSYLRANLPTPHQAEVLNGIAYDNKSGNFMITGKRWPLLFEIKLSD